jgi:5-methylcytosine-specific restriction endonuclease McrA
MQICGKCREAKPPDAYSPSNRGRYLSICRDCRNLMHRGYRETPHGKDTELSYRHRVSVRRIQAVRTKTLAHIRTGDMIRPDACQRCGETGLIVAHHRSYDKPDSFRDVEFLCEPCHRKEHPDGRFHI